MKRRMDGLQVREMCQDRVRWRFIVSAYPSETKGLRYICMYLVMIFMWTKNLCDHQNYYY